MVNEFICSIHLINLPQSIQGLTLCNRKVVVKSLGNIGDYNNSPVLWGFTIMTAIHEFGHFSQRFTKTNDAEWFEHKTPRNELMQKMKQAQYLSVSYLAMTLKNSMKKLQILYWIYRIGNHRTKILKDDSKQ